MLSAKFLLKSRLCQDQDHHFSDGFGELLKNDQLFCSITVLEDDLIITHFQGQLSVNRRSLLSHFSVINWGSHPKMTFDEYRNWDQMRFFEISHFPIIHKKNYSKETRLKSLVIVSDIYRKITQMMQKNDSKIIRWHGLTDHYSYREISVI